VITGVYAPTNGRVTLRGETIAEGYPTGKMKKLYAAGHQGEYSKLVPPYARQDNTSKGVARYLPEHPPCSRICLCLKTC
jgi:ABC-type branched-subunit amino acid transport system ATPase component